MFRPLPVTIASSLMICQPLEGLLQHSLGPNARHTMFMTSSGNVMTTGDGYTLLSSLELSHPIARWIVSRVKSHHGIMGNNAKSYVLIVTEILRQLERSCGNEYYADSKQDLIQIGRAFEHIWSEVFPRAVQPHLLDCCTRVSVVEEHRDEIVGICQNIVKTSLSGNFSGQSIDHISGEIVDLVIGSCQDMSCLTTVIKQLITDYDVTCLEVKGHPIENSRLLEGIVLTRDFVIKSDALECLTDVTFIILACSFDKWTPDVKSTLTARTTDDVVKALQYGTSRIELIISCLVKLGVQLILSSELLTDYSLSICRRCKVSVVHMIPEAELNRLSHLTATDVIHDLSTDIELSSAGIVHFCRSVMLGSQMGVHIGLNGCTTAKQLLLCAPTQGICRQWFIAVFNVLKVLQSWLESSQWLESVTMKGMDNCCGFCRSKMMKKSNQESTSLQSQDGQRSLPQEAMSMQGGGCFELLVYARLRKLLAVCSCQATDPSVAIATEILSHAALCIPRILHRNSFASKSDRSAFLKLLSNVDDSVVRGINGRTGELGDLTKLGVIEPIGGKLALWRDAIWTVRDLLKIDVIISVRTMPMRHNKDDWSDSEDNL